MPLISNSQQYIPAISIVQALDHGDLVVVFIENVGVWGSYNTPTIIFDLVGDTWTTLG